MANSTMSALAEPAEPEQPAAEPGKFTPPWVIKVAIVLLIAVAVVTASILLYQQATAPNLATTSPPLHGTPTVAAGRGDPIKVYVTGAVKAPGVYPLWGDARVADLVNRAGGLAPDADPVRINLAARLVDGQQVNVPYKTTADVPVVSAPAAPPAAVQATDQPATDAPPTPGLVNLNTASAAELDQLLPGVGPVIAGKIVAYRTQQGGFRSVDDLRKVDGMGKALFEKLKPLVTI